MAPPSPRRSSRARPVFPQSQQSSMSSSTSGRVERNTRSHHPKPPSSGSTPSASLSSEPLDEFEDTLLGRRRKRGQEDPQDILPQDKVVMTNESDDLPDEEDEAVRCICGSEDYPGPPPPDAPEAEFFLAHELTEEVTGFFVQCDVCKVWQHGACVGIFSAEASPDEYFCEQCRKDYHKIFTAQDGHRYSKYLPHQRSSRATSRATSVAKDGTRSPRSGSHNQRQSSASASAKRRSTMNSRDAAYDDEQLRKAIEASKEDAGRDSVESTARRPKRGRSDSEENLDNVKRQRTSSRSLSPPTEQPEVPSVETSEEEEDAQGEPKKTRSSRLQRDRSDKDDRERLRQEAALKRRGRAERRRAEDSDLSEDVPLAVAKMGINKSVEAPSVVEPPPTSEPAAPGTPPTSHAPAGTSHKKGMRSGHKRSKGKDQLTRDRDLDNDESPARSMSRDIQKSVDDVPPVSNPKSSAAEHKTTSKAKSALANKMTMTDMRRRVNAIMDFISRTQVDLAAEGTPIHSGESTSDHQSPQKASASGNATPNQLLGIAGENDAESSSAPRKDFKGLNCLEMMDVLTRDMVKWQNNYA